MGRFLAILTVLLCASVNIGFAQQISVETNTSAREIYKGGQVQVSFIINNGRGTNFKSPSIDGLRKLQGPSVSNEVTIVNGRQSSRQVYTFVFQGNEVGKFEISGARVNVGNRTLQFEAVRIEVRPFPEDGDPAGEIGGKPVFVDVQLSHDTTFPGACVYMDYYLYNRVEVGSYDFTALPDLTDFYYSGVGLLDRSVYRVEIDGQRYNKRLLRRVSLFPLTSGTYEIGPTNIRIEIALPGQRRSFFMRQYRSEFISTESMSLVVLPTPAPPPGYIGALGPTTASIRINKVELSTDGSATLTLNVRSYSDKAKLSPPELDLGPDVEVFDPETVRSDYIQHTSTIEYETTWSYDLLFNKPGTYEIHPDLYAFDVDTQAYVALQFDTLSVLVRPGSGLRSNVQSNRDTMANWPVITNARLRRSHPLFFGSTSHILALLAPLLIVGGIKIRDEWKHRQAQAVPDLTPLEKAISRLEAVASSGDSKQYYDTIRGTLENYLSESWQVPLADMTKDQIMAHGTRIGVSKDVIIEAIDILSTCERKVYAGVSDMGNAQKLADRAIQVMESLQSTPSNS